MIFDDFIKIRFYKERKMEKYRVQNKLGEGAFGSVYLVTDKDNAFFAIKSVKLDPFQREDQQKQMEISQHLNHPNIIKIIENTCNQDTMHIVMEYCSQGNIGKFVTHPELKLSPQKILYLLKNIVDAGLFINRQGIIHRDLKPENILLQEDGNPKLIDFGCAKKLPPDDIYEPYNESFDKGTTIYASPQEIKSEKYSAKCDIWSLGCIGYELTYTKHFWGSRTKDQIIEQFRCNQLHKKIIVKENTDSRIAKFLEITLQEKQKQRASWKELSLSRIFEEKTQDENDFLRYLDQLINIAIWTIKQLRQMKNQFRESQEKGILFLFFMIKVCISLYEMKVSLLEKESRYEYLLEHPENVQRNPEILRQLKFQEIQMKEGYQKIYCYLRDRKYFQKSLQQMPKTRKSLFIDLDYAIRFGKKLLNQILDSKIPPMSQEKIKLFTAITKWINFNMWLSYEKKPHLESIAQPQSDLFSWMKLQLSMV